MTTEIRCQREPWRDGVEVAVFERTETGTAIALPLTMRMIREGEMIDEPTIRLRNHEAQQLIDELWRCGLRPTEGTGSAGSLAATEKHLSDMRTIAMGLLKKHGV